ncbi:YdcH family protein [Sphingomonas nostoxanthinifaciens]|uniref:YdcH family protein n=1 Tax=Sphingomonas nostoxanthinifaciens TaxID=2872652 RepID=UPI001CC21A90|nr:YdcH family protein [Sphingomonas nostoxanthinifaciens]UAK23477.1 YdcH family protein [Sphingomonas nostoxanthinifaciens]
MTDSHSATLMAKHARLDAQIANESRRAAPDAAQVSTLKKQKLRIKETLARLL